MCVKAPLTSTLSNSFKTSWAADPLPIISSQQERKPRKKKGGPRDEKKMGNKASDARLLHAEEPSVRSPVPVQPQRQALIPPPARARRTPVLTPVLSAWRRRGSAGTPCVRARAPTRGVLYQYYLPCTSKVWRPKRTWSFQEYAPPSPSGTP